MPKHKVMPVERLLRLWNSGMPALEISLLADVHPEAIYSRIAALRKRGYKIRRRVRLLGKY